VPQPIGPELAGLFATALLLWPLGGAAVVNAVVPGLAYVAGVERVRRAGHPWPARRTAAAVVALLVLGAATSAAVDQRAQASLAWHMTQQMVLLFAVPLALVAARPDELAGRSRRRTPPGAGAALAAAWLAMAGVQWVVHIPAVLDALWSRPAALSAVHWTLVAAGLAFFGCALAAVRSRTLHPLLAALYVASIMAGTDAIGLWLVFDPDPVYRHYALADQHRAGAVMFAAGMVPLLVAAKIAYRWLQPASPPGPLDRRP
jgi:cytochrome c oxidase assembly factor CtaG